MAKLLIDIEVDVNTRVKKSVALMLLHLAVIRGHIEVVRKFIEA